MLSVWLRIQGVPHAGGKQKTLVLSLGATAWTLGVVWLVLCLLLCLSSLLGLALFLSPLTTFLP